MKLYVSGSQRTQNSYRIIKDLLSVSDAFLPIGELSIHNCKGCGMCQDDQTGKCSMQDDMINVYDKIEELDTFVLVSPIYFNHVSGTMKMFVDRLYPFYSTEKCQGKKLYLILTGGSSEKENEEVIKNLDTYFKDYSSWFGMEFKGTTYFMDNECLQPKYMDKILDLKNRIYEE